MQRRSWIEITIDILEVAHTPSSKTRLMYKSNLNFERFNNYFHDLLRKGFIEETNGTHGQVVYKITQRGRTLSEVIKKAQKLAASYEP